MALAEWTELIAYVAREMASLRGDVARLLALQQTKADAPDDALDQLVECAFQAMASLTWSTGELIGRSLHSDPAGLNLRQAIGRTGKSNPKALGRYLALQVPGAGHLTACGLELRRSGTSDNVLCWHVNGV